MPVYAVCFDDGETIQVFASDDRIALINAEVNYPKRKIGMTYFLDYKDVPGMMMVGWTFHTLPHAVTSFTIDESAPTHSSWNKKIETACGKTFLRGVVDAKANKDHIVCGDCRKATK